MCGMRMSRTTRFANDLFLRAGVTAAWSFSFNGDVEREFTRLEMGSESSDQNSKRNRKISSCCVVVNDRPQTLSGR